MVKNESIKSKLWIAWERHRRSRELSRSFNAHLLELTPLKRLENSFLKYFQLIPITIFYLFKLRPNLLFVQNPSIILAFLAVMIKPLFSYKLIIDRHSNFKFDTIHSMNPIYLIFHFLSNYTIRQADLTIVTNSHLADLVNFRKGSPFVLQDKLPTIRPNSILLKQIQTANKNINKRIVFPSSFANDEPIEEFIKATKFLPADWSFYITGNHTKFKFSESIPTNVILTGFLPEDKYIKLLNSSDLIVVLTTQEHTLNCAAYEGVSLLKPLLLSDTKAIKNYFNKGVIYTNPSSFDIATNIHFSMNNLDQLEKNIIKLHNDLTNSWQKNFDFLLSKIDRL
jgi:glycosyltransferase involved in cell wall biosynthesis